MGLRNPHLDDAAFASVWADKLTAGRETGSAAEVHLGDCAECRSRFEAFTAWFEGTRDDAIAEAEAAFSTDRLGTQQAQIARRLEALEQPARVLSFPRFARPVSSQPAGRQRWIAVAAAAGLVVGVGLGQMLEFGGGTARQPAGVSSQQQVARGSAPAPEASVAAVPAGQILDESALFDPEVLPSQVSVPESLQYLNAITPGARDFDSAR